MEPPWAESLQMAESPQGTVGQGSLVFSTGSWQPAVNPDTGGEAPLRPVVAADNRAGTVAHGRCVRAGALGDGQAAERVTQTNAGVRRPPDPTSRGAWMAMPWINGDDETRAHGAAAGLLGPCFARAVSLMRWPQEVIA
ncbi:hypothetical protein GCM10014715_46070 [Streptomyces spiralis]|uniref:Uncharacterized protein n=1 Tax=Streptomyces spiralis TaxID=66376 RepID=A0A919DVB0_9ACTN|nr:hypothetical protein GCM10014715_46070 [Streptomyces spiralis]